ncbi:MAG TPA: hypothetical protein VFE58_09705 [Tepidisphaeraceae bacterium]|jgi:hypothetical protein|nr:hypothetical protein [Tepidisphaeraceae bacterium]
MGEQNSTDKFVDVLSSLGRQALRLNAAEAYEKLVIREAAGNPEAQTLLGHCRPQDLLSVPVKNPDDGNAVLSGLWLWHDWLDASHLISQSLPSATGSFWHAIMHRREGDFSNAKYWYDRCAKHPILPAILAQVMPIVGPMPADKTILKLTMHGWNPHAFVDLVEKVHDKPGDPFYRLAVSVQQLEWRMLFDHSIRQATGTGAGIQFFTPESHGG